MNRDLPTCSELFAHVTLVHVTLAVIALSISTEKTQHASQASRALPEAIASSSRHCIPSQCSCLHLGRAESEPGARREALKGQVVAGEADVTKMSFSFQVKAKKTPFQVPSCLQTRLRSHVSLLIP